MACPLDCNVAKKEKEKIRDYSQLCYDLRRQNPTQRVAFHPLVIGAAGRLSNIKEEVNTVIEDNRSNRQYSAGNAKTVVVYTQQMIHRILNGLLRYHHRLMTSVLTCINHPVFLQSDQHRR